MTSQVLQSAVDSIIRIVDPDIKTVNFAIVMINIALMARVTDIDYGNTYRKTLVDVKEVLDLYLSTLEIARDDN